MSLESKHALVGGGSRGIGLASAQAMASLGATCTLMSRNEESLKAAVASLDNSAGQTHSYLVIDNSDVEGLKSTIANHLSETGINYNILINNTGGPPGGALYEADVSAFEMAYKQHLLSNHVLLQAVLPGMKESGYGRVINIISTSVKQPLGGLGVSNTTRGAVANWSKTLATELGGFGITVNNVLPGATGTERLSDIIGNKSKKSGESETEVEDAMKSIIPLKRFAEPEEVGGAVAFLASPAGAYINGINLPVDGGRLGTL